MNTSRENATSAWARIRRNLGVVLGERAIFAVVNVAATGIATRALGLEALGAIGLLMAFSRLVADLTRCRAWQAVLRYGTELRQAGALGDLRRLIGLTLWIDILAGSIAFAAALIIAYWFGPALGWTDEMIRVAPWFCLTLPFIVGSTQVGILRLYDKVAMIAANHAITAMVRLIGAVAVWSLGGDFIDLALFWVASIIIASLVTYGFAWRVAAQNSATPRMGAALRERSEGFNRFWSFIGATNIISVLENTLPFIAVLVVGAVLGPVEAGIFYLVRQVTEAMARPGDLLGPLFFPEFAILEAKGDRRAMRRLVKRALIWSGLILIAVIAVFAAAGDLILLLLFGAEAAAGYDILLLSSIAAALHVWGFTLEPTLLSMGKAGRALWSAITACAVFGGLMVLLLPEWGLIGVGIALLGHRSTTTAIRFAMVLRLLRKSRL